MTDDLRAALLELESHAPDTDSVRAAVHRGIRTRARRKRLGAVVGAAAMATVLIAGAIVLIDGFARGPEDLAQAGSRLVPIQVPDMNWPFSAPIDDRPTSTRYSITQGGKSVIASRYADREQDVSITVSPTKPPLRKKPEQREQITVDGHPATLRVYGGGLDVEIVWRLSASRWAIVAASSAERAKQVAGELRGAVDAGGTLRSRLDIGLAPEGYRFEFVRWNDPARDDSPRMLVCRPGGVECFVIGPHTQREYFAPVSDGPEPSASGGCRTPETRFTSPMQFGEPRDIDGSSVRLSSNGCFAAKYFDDGRVMMVRAPQGFPISADDFARMAGSMELR